MPSSSAPPPSIPPDRLRDTLARALDGTGPAIRLAQAGAELIPAPPGVALVVATSGSTGIPKQAMLSADALRASASGTAHALGGEGQWLLALPTEYIAGAQVLVRSILAGTVPEVLQPHGQSGFSVAAFTTAAKRMTNSVKFTSLVPTQLRRLLDDAAACRALRRFQAILLGGAPASPDLLAEARHQGLTVVQTYGCAETCGGCVYDGRPLLGSKMKICPDQDGKPRVWLGGDMIAEGYLNDPERSAESFQEHDGVRWYRTEDLGELSAEGTLRVLGRADDVLISGGLKLSATEVARQLSSIQGVQEVFVTGLPDRDWGQRVVAAVVLDGGRPAKPDGAAELLREQAAAALASHEVPKNYLFLDRMPLLGNGKPDRQALIAELRSKFGGTCGTELSSGPE